MALCFKSFSQSFVVTIKGKIDIANDGSVVIISKPVDRFFTTEYIDTDDTSIVRNNRFQKQLDIPANSFILMQCKNSLYSLCFVDSIRDISFEVMTDTVKKTQQVFFFGENARANEILANWELLNIYGKQTDIIEGIIKHAATASIASDSLDVILTWYTNKLLEEYKRDKISLNCYNAFVAETEQRLLYSCKEVLDEGLRNPKAIKMSKKELKILINKLFSEYDPFNGKYFATTILTPVIISKCIFISDGIIPPVINTPKYTWRSYSADFLFVQPYFGVYDFAPRSYQQYLVGNALLVALNHSPMTEAEYMDAFNEYRKQFPGSPYNPVILGKIAGKVFPATNNTRVKLDFHK